MTCEYHISMIKGSFNLYRHDFFNWTSRKNIPCKFFHLLCSILYFHHSNLIKITITIKTAILTIFITYILNYGSPGSKSNGYLCEQSPIIGPHTGTPELPAFTSSSSKYGFSGLKGIPAIKLPGEPLSPAYLKLFSVCTKRSSLGLSSSSGGSAA